MLDLVSAKTDDVTTGFYCILLYKFCTYIIAKKTNNIPTLLD